MAEQAAAASLDTDTVQLILSNHERLKERRAFYESTWREIDRYVDPHGAGGWDRNSSPPIRGADDLFDVTALDGLDRYTAAIAGITIPRQQRWHGIAFDDKELMKLPAVRRWCAHATDRLFTARYATGTGFEAQAHEDIRQEGKYGTSAMWIGEVVGKGLFYKTVHMSEIYIDEDYSGRVDTVHRAYCCSIRNAAAEFGIANLSDKSRQAFEDPKKRNDEIEILHVIRPNREFEPGYLGAKGKAIESLYIEVDQKHVIRHAGFRTMPIPVSRHVTGPRDVYGRSPAMKVLATVKGLNAMARTILDAANKAVDPALLVFDDADITKVITKPGGLTFGGINDQGKPLIQPLQTGAQLPVGLEIQNSEREVVKRAFLDEFFRLLSDPSDRMTATQVMETLQKEGVLIAPFAGRRETEKLGPTIERELDIMMNAPGAIDDLPPEVREAGARPAVQMTNPLSRMARAEEVTGFSRWVEMGIQAAGAGRPDALDRVNFDDGMVNAADVLGVRPTSVYSDDELAEQRAAKQEAQGAAQQAEMAPQLSKAALDMAKARQISNDLGEGGGLG
jgi:hypothetical protein